MALDHLVERKLRLSTNGMGARLYPWSISEYDEAGKKYGGDLIPWGWTLRFRATELCVIEELEIQEEIIDESKDEIERFRARVGPGYRQRCWIHAELEPGDKHDAEKWYRRTTYRMFGSDRAIIKFTLDVYPLESEGRKEKCTSWGMVRYDTKDDFHPEIVDDVIGFNLQLRPSAFENAVKRILAGSVDEVVLSVGGVSGFYAEWSPDIFTTNIKVLADDDQQHVDLPAETTVESPPRLGRVWHAVFRLNSFRTLVDQECENSSRRDVSEAASSQPLVAPETGELVASSQKEDRALVEGVTAIRRLLWLLIGLLFVLIIVERTLAAF